MSKVSTEDFWNKIYAARQISTQNDDNPVLSAALEHFGSVSGANLLDLGCGDGSSSLFFAKKGANVTSIDISEVAVNALSHFCTRYEINNITPIKCSAFDISDLGQFHFVFGSAILHHLEPFASFSSVLRESIVADGKAFFYENSAFSNLLIWFRDNLVGKYGIPKYGDDEEFPLTSAEIEILRTNFTVNIVYPELVFFRLASAYLLRGGLEQLMKSLDDYFFQFPRFRKYSYWQYLLLS